MKPEVFVTLDAPLRDEFIHDDIGWAPSIATVVLRHEAGRVGFQIDDGCGPVIASFLGDCVMIERRNTPRWRTVSGLTLTSADAQYYSRGFFGCTNAQATLEAELRRAERNQKIARQNEILARHGKPLVSPVNSIFDDWHDESGRVRARAIRFLMDCCSETSLWAHSEFGTYARFFADDGDSALAAVSRAAHAAQLAMVVVPQQSKLPAW